MPHPTRFPAGRFAVARARVASLLLFATAAAVRAADPAKSFDIPASRASHTLRLPPVGESY